MRDASTAICAYNATTIQVRDMDFCRDVIGRMSLVDYLCQLILGVQPSDAQRAVVEAAIIALSEHGLTPSVLAARLTYMGAPESLQGAVAAGLLGVGDQFVGTVELVAPLLVEISGSAGRERQVASGIVARLRAEKKLIPGFGQPHHKPDDPRSPALFAVAERVGANGAFVAALKLFGEEVDKAAGRHMTINAPAAVAALFLEVGIPVRIMRGFVIVGRCIGLVAHLAEEQAEPAGRAIWDAAAHAVNYTGKPLV